jgi:hypothetical protein
MIIGNKMAETVMQPVFKLKGLVFFPHYVDKHRWVGPGSRELREVYTTTELIELGAEQQSEHLWPRSWTDEVK